MEKFVNGGKIHHHRFCSTSLLVLVSFVIASSAFGILYFLVNSHIQGWSILPNDNSYAKQKNFYASLDPKEKKGFIIGSSLIIPLNATYIQQYLSTNNQNYKIYNLSIPGDKPTSRWDTIDMIISSHPDFIVYEISDIDFTNWNSDYILQQNLSTIPVIKQSTIDFYLELETLFGFHTYYLHSPKVSFLTFIGQCISCMTSNDVNTYLPLSNYPFTDIPNSIFKVSDNDQLRTKMNLEEIGDIDSAPINENAIIFNKIVKKIHENNIKLVVFTAPVSRYHLDHMGNDRIKAFHSVIDHISSQSNIHIYQFFDKYADLPIFTDLIHVSFNQDCNIYCQDISKIILKEIEN